MQNIGYACLTVGVPGTRQRTCTAATASPKVLLDLIESNLAALDKIINYNSQNGIKLFRISSDIIPFGSHPVNTLRWQEIFANQLANLGRKAIANGLRLSMHPGQYTVLNSPDADVVRRAIEDLRYHAGFLDALGLSREHKIILHVGGVYGDKAAATERFVRAYRLLDENIRRRLVIENDDRQYTISDVLSIGKSEGIPVVFDNLHHQVNPDDRFSETEWIAACAGTWTPEDGKPKIHYSQQDQGKRPGSHSATLDASGFLRFYSAISDRDLDIMVEVKDKNLSAIKCINAISAPEIRRLEKEWGRYKYLVLEHSPQIYRAIRELLKDKHVYPVADFYGLIDEAIASPVKPGNAVTAAQHGWGYFKDVVDAKTKQSFEKLLLKVGGGGSALALKRLLWRLTVEQMQTFLLDSLYFMELF